MTNLRDVWMFWTVKIPHFQLNVEGEDYRFSKHLEGIRTWVGFTANEEWVMRSPVRFSSSGGRWQIVTTVQAEGCACWEMPTSFGSQELLWKKTATNRRSRVNSRGSHRGGSQLRYRCPEASTLENKQDPLGAYRTENDNSTTRLLRLMIF